MEELCREKDTDGRKMEDEIKCPVCFELYNNPVLLPCSHSMCLPCAKNREEPAQHFLPQSDNDGAPIINPETDLTEVDTVSVVSETDSGIVCNSRPSSYIGTPSINNIFFLVMQGCAIGIRCPLCKKAVVLDDKGANSLPKNRILEGIVEKYGVYRTSEVKCQLCERVERNKATVMCEQCEVFYCDQCRDNCHPPRGPLAIHNLVDPSQGKSLLRAKSKGKEAKCDEHVEEQLSMYCLACKLPVCYLCVQDDGKHSSHDLQAIGQLCKAQKSELSQNLQYLSERAKSGTEFVQRLKTMIDRIPTNCVEFESIVVAQCDQLIETIRRRKHELLQNVNHEKEMKMCVLKEQVAHCTSLIQRTTGLLQYCIEVLKESDPSSFLQISNSLISRVAIASQNFNKEMELAPRISPEFELTLDNTPALQAVETLNFFQMKDGIVAPGKPVIVPEECSAENNSVTIAWQPYYGSIVEAYTLELDDGNEGDFRVVYVGRETICTVDGLHFNSIYNARVKAHNHAGESEYSEIISLQTAEVAWFRLDPLMAHPEIIFSDKNMAATCNSFDHKVVMGSVGFSKGVHYWEVTIDRYDKNTDPAIGIARFDVDKSVMLGKDDKAWSMYIDDKRSWFMHCDEHTNRTEGGIQRGSTIGVLLDLNKHTLSYYVDDEPHGPVAFTDLHGVFFPAISLNRNVEITLHTGLAPPIETGVDEEHV